jgi:hypothetical protein
MADRTFTVTADVAVAPAAAIAFLVDLTRHRGLHPFLQSATVVASGPDWQEWDVVERPSAGPVRYTVRFRARVVRDAPGAMSVTVRVRPGVELVSHTVASGAGGGARLTETTSTRAPWGLRAYVARTALRAHERTYRRLPEHLLP